MSRFFILFFLFFISSGCVTIYNPATEKREIYFIDENMEILIGKNFASQILKEKKVCLDKELNLYVKNIGKKIASVSHRDYLKYHFYILEDKEINAFALPGGFVFVNKGLVDIANKDELAFCLGHEIAHICARHPVKRLQASLGIELLLSIALRNPKYADLRRGLDIIYKIIALGYSRQDEFLADSLGVYYSYKAGFNPYGAITLLKKLKKKEKVKPLVFLSSHPPLEARIENIEKRIERLKKEKIALLEVN